MAPAVATREVKQREVVERVEGRRTAEGVSSRIEEVSLDSLAADKARLCLYEQRFKARYASAGFALDWMKIG